MNRPPPSGLDERAIKRAAMRGLRRLARGFLFGFIGYAIGEWVLGRWIHGPGRRVVADMLFLLGLYFSVAWLPLLINAARSRRARGHAVTSIDGLRSLDGEPFDAEIAGAPPLLVYFSAVWCKPCEQVAPIVERIAGSLSGQLQVGKLDIDDYPLTAKALGVDAIPALIMYRNGYEVVRLLGSRRTEGEVLARVRVHLAGR